MFESWDQAISSLLGLTSHVEQVIVDPCSVTVIRLIAQHASASLRDLNFSILFGHPSFDGLDLGSLVRLQYLTILMTGYDWSQEGAPPFKSCMLPCLEELVWQGFPSTGFFRFLAYSTFGSLRTVKVMNSSELSRTATEDLIRFLDTTTLEELVTGLSTDDECMLITPHIKSTKLMIINGDERVVPPPPVATYLSPTVKQLLVHCFAHTTYLWEFLHALRHAKTCHLDSIIIMTTAPGEMFSWIAFPDMPPEHGFGHLYAPAFIGNLLGYAAALKLRGVSIRDAEKLTVTECMEGY